MSDVEVVEKPKRKRAPAAKKKRTETVYGRKTLVAAIIAAILALADLYVTARHGVKLPF